MFELFIQGGLFPFNMKGFFDLEVGSVGWVPDYRAGGRGFEPRPDQHLGSLNNWGESAAFVMTSANG